MFQVYLEKIEGMKLEGFLMTRYANDTTTEAQKRKIQSQLLCFIRRTCCCHRKLHI